MTALTIIKRALKPIGVLGLGQALSAPYANDGLEVLNLMVNSWKAQRLTMTVERRATFSLVSGTQDYTIGTGGDFNTARPDYLPRISVIQNPGSSQPLELPLDVYSTQQWQQNVPVKSVQSALPSIAYYDYAFPLGTISYYPVPNVSGLETALYLATPLTEFANLSTDYDFPPAAEEALIYQLAIRLAPEYGRKVTPEVGALAIQSFAIFKRANIRMEYLRVDSAIQRRAGGGQYDWRNDTNA